MSALDDLIKLIQDDDLRGRLKAEFDKLRKRKKFGLVFESKDEYATLPNRVVRLGDPIYPTLTKLDEVCNAPEDNLWHVLIEAENFHALQLLKYLYAGKVDCIYIDPPYNTGARDWKYNDNYVDAADTFRHSKWLSMMERRLKLAKELLSDSGAIFISIDDNEQATLKLLCDDIFGYKKFVAQFPWRKRTAKSDVPCGISQDFESVLCYANENFIGGVKGKPRKYFETPDFPGRPWRYHDLTTQKIASTRPNSDFTIVNPKNGKSYPNNPMRCWAITKDTFPEYYAADRIIFPGDYPFLKISKPVLRYWKADDMAKADGNFGIVAASTKLPETIGMTQDGTKELAQIFNDKRFAFPKPLQLIKHLINIATIRKPDALIVDFFAGSGTTLHAVNLLNAQDGGKRRCILVTNNEVSDAEAKTLRKQGLTPDDDAWQALGIARHVTWQRTVCSIEGHDINGTPLSGNYLGTDLPMADGFKANAVFFKLDYLDKDNVALGKSFKELLPVLWLKAGGIGECPTLDAEEPFKIFAANRFAVLLDEKRFKEFAEALRGAEEVETIFIATGSKAALNRMRKLLNVPQCVQLYGDYLKHFNRKEVTR